MNSLKVVLGLVVGVFLWGCDGRPGWDESVFDVPVPDGAQVIENESLDDFQPSPGESVVLRGTTITGSVSLNDVNLFLEGDAQITSSLTLNGGTLVITDGSVNSSVHVTGATAVVLERARLGSTLRVDNADSLALRETTVESTVRATDVAQTLIIDTTLGSTLTVTNGEFAGLQNAILESTTTITNVVTVDAANCTFESTVDISGGDEVWVTDSDLGSTTQASARSRCEERENTGQTMTCETL